MQVLKELVYIVSKNKLDHIDLIGDSSSEKSKVEEFYEGLVEGTFSDDDDAASYFYGSDKNASGYQKLKGNLKNKLIHSLFFLDIKEVAQSERQRAYYSCYRDWAATKILIGKGARLSGVSLCHKIMKQAKKYEITALVLDVARTMRLHYGTREGDHKKFDQYNSLFKAYEKIWIAENRAEELYTELIIKYVNNKSTKTELHEKAKAYYEILKPDLEKYDSYRLHLCGSLIRVSIYTSINDYEHTISICEEALAYFEQKSYKATTPLQIFYYQLLICFTQLKQYEEGRRVAAHCIELLEEEGSFNWFKYHELQLILCFHTGEFKAAYDLYLQIVQHPRFQFMPDNVKEMWRIFEAYIHYLIEVKRIEPEPEENYFNRFKLGRFLNDMPIFSKDKRGMNIPILIIHVLFMIHQSKYDKAIDKIEAIEKYCSRHLRRNDTFRSNCFIRMLMKIPANGFHKAGVLRKAKPFLDKLKSMPLDVANQTNEIEIIPYENLWSIALETLDYKFHKFREVKATV